MVDFTKMGELAQRLILANGRMCRFFKASEVPFESDKPWNKRKQSPDNPGDPGNFQEYFDTPVSFVPPNTVRQFGLSALGEGTEYEDLVAFSQQIGIFFPAYYDVRLYTKISDRDVNWNVIGYQVLRPADDAVLAFVGVRR